MICKAGQKAESLAAREEATGKPNGGAPAGTAARSPGGLMHLGVPRGKARRGGRAILFKNL